MTTDNPCKQCIVNPICNEICDELEDCMIIKGLTWYYGGSLNRNHYKRGFKDGHVIIYQEERTYRVIL